MNHVRSNARLSREVIAGFVALALVLIGGAVFNADGLFFQAQTHLDALGQNAPYGILACGLTLVIITGGIDLAVGSIVALAGVAFALIALKHEMAAWIAWIAALAVGTASGLTAGSLIAHARLQPFVATLAIMAFARGLAKWSTDGVKIQKFPYPPILEALNYQLYIGGVDRITVLDINDHRHSLDNLIKNCNNDEKEAIDIAIKGILYMPVIDKRSQRTYSVGSPPASLPPMLAEFALSDSTTIDKVSTD